MAAIRIIYYNDLLATYNFEAYVVGTIDACAGVESFSSNQINIYRDGDVLRIKNGGLKIDKVSVYNSIGQNLYDLAISNLKPEIDISNLSPGIYFLQLQTETGSVVKKFVKE
ncbi:MAG: T9SS type A sorting domain-containing protein [Flavobacterium sp.]